jgi:adenylate cyclase
VEPKPGDIRYHLGRVLGSAAFSASPTSSRLLQYLVEETLAGRAERLKGYSIGIDVFDRKAEFDAGSDSIVRVQMGRLRKMLADYYASDEGRDASLRFAFPKGSYVPLFESDDGSPPVQPGWWQRNAKRVWLSLALITLVVGATGFAFRDKLFPPPERTEPRLFVAQFNAVDGSTDTGLIAKGLQHDLIALLSQYPNLEVLGYETVSGEGNGKKISEWHGADYLLSGSVTTGSGTIKVSSELTSVRKGVVLWSDRSNFAYDDIGDVLNSQSDIALSVGAVLGQPDGVIQQASKALVAESAGVSFANYACILSAYDYKRRKDSANHLKIRNCLEKATRDNPGYASAWSMLSWIYGDEYRYGFNFRPGLSSAQGALRAAEAGVKSNPFSATAHQYLGIAQFYLRRDEAAKKSLQTARRLSPNNSEILADIGWQSALSGSSEDARFYFDEAIKLNPDPPSWYWGGLAIDAIRSEDAERAQQFAALYSGDGLLSLYVKIAAARLNGDMARVRAMMSVVGKTYPGYDRPGNDFIRRNRIDAQFEKWIFGSAEN